MIKIKTFFSFFIRSLFHTEPRRAPSLACPCPPPAPFCHLFRPPFSCSFHLSFFFLSSSRLPSSFLSVQMSLSLLPNSFICSRVSATSKENITDSLPDFLSETTWERTCTWLSHFGVLSVEPQHPCILHSLGNARLVFSKLWAVSRTGSPGGLLFLFMQANQDGIVLFVDFCPFGGHITASHSFICMALTAPVFELLFKYPLTTGFPKMLISLLAIFFLQDCSSVFILDTSPSANTFSYSVVAWVWLCCGMFFYE